MRIAISGATGFIGRQLCAALDKRGDKIIALTRDVARAKRVLPENTEFVDWLPGSTNVSQPDLSGLDAVVHLAGEPINGRWSAERKRIIYESRVHRTRELIDAIASTEGRPRILISGSAIGYYGDRGNEILSEDALPGNGFLAKVCFDWEAEAARAESLGVRVVQIRTGLVLGPGGGILKQMLAPYSLGMGGPLGSGRQWMSWIHIDDEVGLMLHTVDKDVRGAMNATAPEPVTNRHFARSLGAVLRRPAIVQVPAFALRLVLGEASEMVLGSQRVMPSRALASGYQFRHVSLASALAGCLQR